MKDILYAIRTLSAIEEITDVIPTGIKEHNIYVYRMKEVNVGLWMLLI